MTTQDKSPDDTSSDPENILDLEAKALHQKPSTTRAYKESEEEALFSYERSNAPSYRDFMPKKQAIILILITAIIGIFMGMFVATLSKDDVSEDAVQQRDAHQTTPHQNIGEENNVSQRDEMASEKQIKPDKESADDVNILGTLTNEDIKAVEKAAGLLTQQQPKSSLPAQEDIQEIESKKDLDESDVEVEVLDFQDEALSIASDVDQNKTETSDDALKQIDKMSLPLRTTQPSDESIASTSSQSDNTSSAQSKSQSQSEPLSSNIASKPIFTSEEIKTMKGWIERGDGFLQRGDIITARRFYELAAQKSYADGVEALARTYDATVLSTLPVLGVESDAQKAQELYERARRLRQ